MRVIFIMPGAGGGGGAHSVVQETLGLRRLGVEAAIAISQETAPLFAETYPELAAQGVETPAFIGADDLHGALASFDLAVATTAPSTQLLADCLARLKAAGQDQPRAAYYVQDYEPLFFAPGSPPWHGARRSYGLIPDALLFAKTDWLCAMVNSNHNIPVARVRASIDHGAYYPTLAAPSDQVRICAMIRPNTPRRAPRRTARILARLAELHGERVSLSAFGAEPEALERRGLHLPECVRMLGVLSRREVAQQLRNSDLFLDLSDFQAFGRTGLEGMACGCVPVLPLFGGAWEYARDRQNAFLVDTRSDEAILEAVQAYVASSPGARALMREDAIATALDYSIERAAFSEFKLFSQALGRAA